MKKQNLHFFHCRETQGALTETCEADKVEEKRENGTARSNKEKRSGKRNAEKQTAGKEKPYVQF